MTLKRNEQGFTIIEVVLVLAIAGLIFLMIFIALPALQRSQRDTGRKNDIATVAAAVNSYKSNNKNNLTGLTTASIKNYVDELSQYDKNTITVTTVGGSINEDTVRVYKGRTCGTQNGTATPQLATGSTRAVAVVGGIENNGSQVLVYCQDV